MYRSSDGLSGGSVALSDLSKLTKVLFVWYVFMWQVSYSELWKFLWINEFEFELIILISKTTTHIQNK